LKSPVIGAPLPKVVFAGVLAWNAVPVEVAKRHWPAL
jgi:hypothetical protein